jgi:hypothetical protein
MLAVEHQVFLCFCAAKKNVSVFPPNALAGSGRFLGRYVVGSTLGPVLYSAPVSRILGAPRSIAMRPPVLVVAVTPLVVSRTSLEFIREKLVRRRRVSWVSGSPLFTVTANRNRWSRHVETAVVRPRTLLSLVGVMSLGCCTALVSGGVVPKTRILSWNFLT